MKYKIQNFSIYNEEPFNYFHNTRYLIRQVKITRLPKRLPEIYAQSILGTQNIILIIYTNKIMLEM